jgi:hypothetical protein
MLSLATVSQLTQLTCGITSHPWLLAGIHWPSLALTSHKLLLTAIEPESYIMTDGQSASLSWNKAPAWGLWPDFYYYKTAARLLMGGHSLWREDGSVVYNCSWPLPALTAIEDSNFLCSYGLDQIENTTPSVLMLRVYGAQQWQWHYSVCTVPLPSNGWSLVELFCCHNMSHAYFWISVFNNHHGLLILDYLCLLVICISFPSLALECTTL